MRDTPYSDHELERLSSSLKALARHLVLDDDTAEDLVQEAWLAALEQPTERVRDLTGWLRRVLSNLAVRHHTRQARRQEIEEWAARREDGERLEELAERLSTLRLLERTVDSLDEPYRTVIRLRFFDDLSATEVATRLERPLATVQTQVKRGLQRMRARLDGSFHGDRRAWATTLLAGLELDVRSTLPLDSEPEDSGGSGGSDATGSTDAGHDGPRTSKLPARIAWGSVVTAVVLGVVIHLGSKPTPRPELARPDSEPEGKLVLVRAPELADEREPADEPVAAVESEPTPLPEGSGRIVFQVEDASGAPVPGATIELAEGASEVRCDATGRGEVLVLEDNWRRAAAGTPRLSAVARAPGFAESMQYDLALPERPPAGGLHVSIRLRSPEVVMEIEVVDRAGQPIRGARIDAFGPRIQDIGLEDGTLLSEPRHRVSLPDSGLWRLEKLAEVERTFRVSAPGYGFLRYVEPARGPALRHLRLVLEPGATLRGTVRDPDGSPLAGARVWTDVGPNTDRNPAETRSDASGAYVLEGLDPGWHFLFARDPYDAEWIGQDVREMRPGEEARWDPVVEPRPAFRGRCLLPDGSPLAGSGIQLRPLGERYLDWVAAEWTDAEGRFAVHPVPDGDLELSVLGRNMRETLQSALVVEGIQADFEEHVFEVEEPEIPQGRVRGQLLGVNGEVLTDARMRLESASSQYHRRSIADPWGNFRFTNLPDGHYELIVRLGGQGLGHLASVEIRDAGEVDVGLVTPPETTTLHVEWRWDDGIPSRVTIESGPWFPDRRAAWRWQPVLENAPGPLPRELELLPGRHTILVDRDGQEPTRRHIFLESTPMRVVLGEELFPQAFRMTSGRGGGQVTAYRVEQPEPIETLDPRALEAVHDARVEPQGSDLVFELTLPLGRYLVEARRDDGSKARRLFLLEPDPTTTSVLQMAGGY